MSKLRSQGTTRSQWFRGFEKLPKKRLCTRPILSIFFVLVEPLSLCCRQNDPGSSPLTVHDYFLVFLSQATKEEQQPLCCVVATGVYPTLCIADACTTGVSSSISKLHLWKLFSLDTLNEYLARDPAPGELIYKFPTRHR